MPDFPVTLTHPDTGGETQAATRTSLRTLEARGWKRKPAPRRKTAPPEPEQSED